MSAPIDLAEFQRLLHNDPALPGECVALLTAMLGKESQHPRRRRRR